MADALSRAAIEEVRLGVDFGKMAELQRQDPETLAYKTAVTALKWAEVNVDEKHKLLCDTSMGTPRPLVPAGMRREVFDVVHGLSHPGTNASVKIMKSRFVWHGIAKDVREWARACVACQTAKVHRHNKAPLHKFATPTARFAHVHVDLVGPLPMSERIFAHPYCHRPIYAVAGGHSTSSDRRSLGGEGFRPALGRPFRGTGGHHVRPRSTVHVGHVESSYRNRWAPKCIEPLHTILKRMGWWSGSTGL